MDRVCGRVREKADTISQRGNTASEGRQTKENEPSRRGIYKGRVKHRVKENREKPNQRKLIRKKDKPRGI